MNLREPQRTALERRAELLRLLQAFREERLDGYCPELTSRVTALIYGTPTRSHRWGAVHHQLKVAGKLFEDVQIHAFRLAADEVVQAEVKLRRRLRGATNPSFRASAQALLAELEASGTDVLPSADLRARLIEATRGNSDGRIK